MARFDVSTNAAVKNALFRRSDLVDKDNTNHNDRLPPSRHGRR